MPHHAHVHYVTGRLSWQATGIHHGENEWAITAGLLRVLYLLTRLKISEISMWAGDWKLSQYVPWLLSLSQIHSDSPPEECSLRTRFLKPEQTENKGAFQNRSSETDEPYQNCWGGSSSEWLWCKCRCKKVWRHDKKTKIIRTSANTFDSWASLYMYILLYTLL